MLDLFRNNLDKSSSPYLRQHAKNPIWWQEWSSEVLEEAVRENKPLFVSVGYATCHWCHVMAADAFSDRITADYLNKHFTKWKRRLALECFFNTGYSSHFCPLYN